MKKILDPDWLTEVAIQCQKRNTKNFFFQLSVFFLKLFPNNPLCIYTTVKQLFASDSVNIGEY
jgi:hypothetical protein